MSEVAIQELEEQYAEQVQKIHELYANPIPLTDVERVAQQRAEQQRQLHKAEAEAERIESQLAREKEAAQQTAEYAKAVARLQAAQDTLAASLEAAYEAAATCGETRQLLKSGAFKQANRDTAQVPAKYWNITRRNRFRESHLFATEI